MLLHSAPIGEQVAGDRGQVVGDNKTPTLRENREGWGTQQTLTPHTYNPTPDTYHLLPSVPVDLLFDDHAVELEECRRWANSDAGQIARIENPAGFANVRAHAEAHLSALGLANLHKTTAPKGPRSTLPLPEED